MRRRSLLAAPLLLGGCAAWRRRHRKAPPAAVEVHPVIGAPYQAAGVWRYPRASFDYDETGLAVVATAHPALATDGAPWDPSALMAAHPTLQLPAVLRVTNLETGREVLLRLDDRGPAAPGRLLAVTPRAALLLGPGSEAGVLRVRVRIEETPSRQLAAALGDPEAPTPAVTAVPVGAVRSEILAPPPGIVGRASLAEAETAPVTVADPAAAVPLRLPEAVTQGPARATRLWIDAGGVGQARYADLLSARLAGFGAMVVRSPTARPETAWRVRIGPFTTAAEAGATLDRVLGHGVVDARIVVD